MLDAVDEILMDSESPSLSLRQVEIAAGASHGSVRYHFDTLEGLLVAAFSRQNADMVERQADLFGSDMSTLDKWRTASRELFDADIASGWTRRMVEVDHLAINHPDVRSVVQTQMQEWNDLLAGLVRSALAELDLELTESQIRGLATTIGFSQSGAMVAALAGGHPWHEDYLNSWDDLIIELEKRKQGKRQ